MAASNTGVISYGGGVSSCNFYGKTGAIDDESGSAVKAYDATRISDCHIDQTHVYVGGGNEAIITGNTFFKNAYFGSDKPSVIIEDSIQVHITNNTFDGSGPSYNENYIVFRGDVNGVIVSKNVLYNGGIELSSDTPDDTGGSVDSIDISNNLWYGGGNITSTTIYNWRMADINISENQFGSFYYGGGGIISFTGVDKQVHRLRIAGNIIDTFSNTGDPVIEVEFRDDGNSTHASGSLIDISNNTISVDTGANTKAIKLQGIATYPYRGDIVINGNHILGSDGIDISDTMQVVMKYNTFVPHPYSYRHDDYSAQVEIAATKMASVESNVFVAGQDGDTYGTTALLKVSVSESGSLINNTFYGANTGSMVTACIADGPLHIKGNQYPGTHSLLGGTAFTNELVLTGSGAIMGSNPMCFDATAATNVKYLHMRETVFSKEGALSIETGALRFAFREDAQIVSVSAMCGTAPTGASILVDVNNSETQQSIFTGPGRPEILATEFDSGEVVPNDIWVNAGEYLTVDIDQVGSTVAGEDLTVMILWVRNCAEPYPD